ncbi:MAG TPA: metallophosphoesterase [Spirochaetota bacterium]|nr:metallophosphoesterase [Spirochaetota bacterium]
MIELFTVDNIKSMDFYEFENILDKTLCDPNPPDLDFFKTITSEANKILSDENDEIRPKDKNKKSGGLVNLSTYPRAVILPDLHARRFFLKSVLKWNLDGESVVELLEKNKIALLCLGDGVHGEGVYASRWLKAFEEYKRDFRDRDYMDKEIADSFNLMIAVMLLKIRYNDNFHFLKGNHENITNETGNGNFSFAKYANEGAMVVEYFEKFYDMELLNTYSDFEKNLPLFVLGKNFLASHAEPQFFFNAEKIINYREDGDLIEALTWTENFSAKKGTVDDIISYFFKENDGEKIYYFGGHRPISSLYNKINNDRYVQIHNPAKEIAAVINSDIEIDLDRDIKIVPKI